MVDQEARTYRPRRAFIESEVQSAQPEMPAKSYRENARPIAPGVDEDRPKPLYRDELRTNGGSSPASRAFPVPEVDPPTDETLRPITFTPRRTRGADDETTTILPRSRVGQRPTQAPLDAINDYDEDERKLLNQRAKLALLIGAVAAVAVIGLVIGYAVLAAGKQPQNKPSVPPSAGGNGTSGNVSEPPGQTGAAPLTDASMLNPDQAKILARDRTWKVTSTEPSPSEDAPAAACFGGAPPQGQLTPQQRILRVLNSSGKKAPVALHEATAYSTADEAIQAYTIASKTIGGCAVTGFYIESGHAVSGVGNLAAGVVVIDVSKRQAHSVILNQTGRVVNIIDAYQPSKALAITAVAKALGQVNSVQCGPAGGACNGTARVKDGPPPLGDEPGFLATGDLPPTRAKVGPWVPAEIEPPKPDFKGSGCETVNWATVPAKPKSWRTYLYTASGNNFFGLDEIVLTTKDAKAANKLVDKIKSDLRSCKSPRVLTASVTKPNKVTSVGAQKTKIAGWTAVVSQKTTDGTAKYRVGIVAAGSRVIYTFVNPKGDYDVTSDQWDTLAVRAGERVTQVN